MQEHLEAQTWLQERGVGLTLQRILIVDYLLRHPCSHSSADTIYQGLINEGNSLARATVYNNLRTLFETGALVELETGQFGRHYDIDKNDHAHKVCRECGKIEDAPLPIRMQEMQEVAGDDFSLHTVQLTLYGICSSCRAKAAENQSDKN